MVHNIFFYSKTANILSNFTNNILPSYSYGEMYWGVEISMHCFNHFFNIMIQNHPSVLI